MKFYITHGISKGKETQGYRLMTARDAATKKVLSRQCGGGYDMTNAMLCAVLNNAFQAELNDAMKNVDLAGSDTGGHPYYCFHRYNGQIGVNGMGGSGITAKLCQVLGIELTQDADGVYEAK